MHKLPQNKISFACHVAEPSEIDQLRSGLTQLAYAIAHSSQALVLTKKSNGGLAPAPLPGDNANLGFWQDLRT